MGGIVGGLTALLFAPKPGEELREELSDHYARLSEDAVELLGTVCDHSLDLIERAKDLAEDAQEVTQKYLHKEKDNQR